MSKIEKKYPLQFEKARLLPSKQLERGVSFYKNGGGFTHRDWENDEGKR